MSRGLEKWLLVKWNDGGVDVVHIRSLLNTRLEDLQPGSPLKAYLKGEPKTGTFICKSNDHKLLEQMQEKMKSEAQAGPSNQSEQEQEPEDFSASASSWEPSDENASDSDEIDEKKVKLEQSRKPYTNENPKRRVLTPSHRANAVIPEAMSLGNYFQKILANRKRSHGFMKQSNDDKSLPDSTKKNNVPETTVKSVTMLSNFVHIRDSFQDLFGVVKCLGPLDYASFVLNRPASPELTPALENMPVVSDDEKENDSQSGESDRSEDNILISNKYKKYNGNNTNNNNSPQVVNIPEGEWIGIGSGKTLIHKDKFRKVNFKSYTIATRTLLLALFPRRVLATHSLTGKRSPAFQNKPAKMCLDPKIISDVIMEIQDRFNVRENLIRSIITTKCADECKMYKMRQGKRKTMAADRTKENDKNVPDEDRNNRTA